MATQVLTKVSTLTEKETRALAEFRQRLHAVLPGQVRSIILFGSKARGDTWDESDIDLLVVLRHKNRTSKDAVADAELETWKRTGVMFAPLVLSQTEVEEDQSLGTPFMQNVAQDGIVIEGEGIVVKEVQKEILAEELMDSARERLRIAQVVLDSGGYRDSISRAYYAILDATDALLILKGLTPKSHAGSLYLFRKHFVETGLAEEYYARWFGRAEQDRLDADYPRRGRVLTAEDAEVNLSRAEAFLAMAEQLLPKLLTEGAECQAGIGGELGEAP